MRVIAGEAKGRRLRSVPGLATRPTADRVRQTLFDILGDVSGARVLDLFAGTGALGIEALSRGAAHALFVERSVPAAAVIKENLQLTGFAGRSSVRRADAEALLKKPAGSPYDLVFLDPPYERGLAFVAGLVALLAEGGWVEEGGIVVAEAAAGAVVAPAEFREIRARTFGRTQITFLEQAPRTHPMAHQDEPTRPDQ